MALWSYGFGSGTPGVLVIVEVEVGVEDVVGVGVTEGSVVGVIVLVRVGREV
jgi:hypothetical protein